MYHRLVSIYGIKMKALVAVQRKMLELSYILVKNKTTFIKNYEQKKREAIECELSSEASLMLL